MVQVRIDLLRDWKAACSEDGVRFFFPTPSTPKGFYPVGFVRKNDSVADFVGWYGLSAVLRAIGTSNICTVEVTAFFAEQDPLHVKLPVLFHGDEVHLEIPFSVFPLETVKGNRWEFVSGFQITGDSEEFEVKECVVKRRKDVYIHMPVKGKAGEAGKKITYQGFACNCASEQVAITAEQIFDGWESLFAEIQLDGGQETLILAPGECSPLTVSVTVHDNMVPGGHENTVIRLRSQGSRTAGEDRITLKTMRRLPHPYLYHDTAGWQKVRENIGIYEPYRQPWQAYLKKANGWIVTDPMVSRPFCYETRTEEDVMSTAYAFAVTGDLKYARKLADFYRRFSNPEIGYPVKKRGCSQSYVQEGHFFKHLAAGYDVICDSGILTDTEKSAIEDCFRVYMDMLDVHILDGHISNWILSELQGALFCALVLQDMERAQRFAVGTGGIVEQFRHGIFNDGWWHECSVGYNTWVSSIMLHTAHALLPFGINLIHAHFLIPFNKEVDATYHGEAPKVEFGMYNQKWGGNQKSYVCIKDMFDAPLPFLDYRGILFGIADSDEKRLSGVHFGSTYDLAFHYYHDQKYLPVIARNEPDPIFGTPEDHQQAVKTIMHSPANKQNAFANNIGLALLRSQAPGREQREQIQAVLRYGSHGYAHGHFDITDLLSVMRYGRSFYNPENCWWGYAHFMYKFYVQCSLTKNMVVVDEKMQIPADSRLILWHSENGLQAAGVEVQTAWSYPPYGGMVYRQDGQSNTKEDLRNRCRMNRCCLPIIEGEGSPAYGELTGFTEPILQKRIMAVTNDYIVLFDYLEGEQEHQYDSLMQVKGFVGIDGTHVIQTRHTEQMNPNPVSDAQFITDCNWYRVQGGSTARFRTIFTEEHTKEHRTCDRSNYNEPGILKMDIHTAWPRHTEQMVGRVAVYDGWAADGEGYTIPLAYRLELDGKTVESGEFDGWILGRGELSADVHGVSQAVLILRQGTGQNELGDQVTTPQGVFWGEICLELEDGTVINVGKYLQEKKLLNHEFLDIRMENVDIGFGIGRDYKGGRVTIIGTEYPYALGASPINHQLESRITLDLSTLHVRRLTACVGVDAFAGDEWQKRKVYAVRTHGKIGRYVTVIEPYETDSIIAGVCASQPDSVQVALRDGTVQTVTLTGVQGNCPSISLITEHLKDMEEKADEIKRSVGK